MTTPHLQAHLAARERLQTRWLRLHEDSRAELDDLTIAASLGVLTAEWLAGLPEEVADSWIELFQKRLEEIRDGVS